MHAHNCHRCQRPFNHERFIYARHWNAVERIVARALHRFYGACPPCIHKFMNNQFSQDKEIAQLEVRSVHHI